MLATWDYINQLTDPDEEGFIISVDLNYKSVAVSVWDGFEFRYATLRQEDHKYDIYEAIDETIQRFKRELRVYAQKKNFNETKEEH